MNTFRTVKDMCDIVLCMLFRGECSCSPEVWQTLWRASWWRAFTVATDGIDCFVGIGCDSRTSAASLTKNPPGRNPAGWPPRSDKKPADEGK